MPEGRKTVKRDDYWLYEQINKENIDDKTIDSFGVLGVSKVKKPVLAASHPDHTWSFKCDYRFFGKQCCGAVYIYTLLDLTRTSPSCYLALHYHRPVSLLLA